MKIKEPSDLIKTIYKKLNKNDVFAIIIMFVLGLINNINFVITDGVAPDALTVSDFGLAGKWELSLGRFGIGVVNLIRFGLVNRFIIVLICLLFLAISSIIIIRTFEIKNKIAIFLVTASIAVAPQFTDTYMFIYCADAYCLAFLLATLTVFFLKKLEKGKRYHLLAVTCTIIVCSLYQAYLGVLIGGTILLLINYLLNNMKIKEVCVQFLKYMLTIFVGILVYYILLKIIICISEISLASYKGANSLGIDTITSLPQTIIQIYKDFFNFFFTNQIINNIYWCRDIINMILFIISFAGLIFVLLNNKYNDKAIRILLLILLLCIYPIGVAIMGLIAPTVKLNLLTSVGLITITILEVLIYQKLKDDSFENIIKYGYIVLRLVLIFTFILSNTFTYMHRQQAFRNYYTISNDIYSRVVQLDEYSTDKKWMFSDIIEFDSKYKERANGHVSDDNVTYDNYNGTLQNANFYEKYLGIKITICSRHEYKQIVNTNEFLDMPIYPNKGSIKIINDVIVIKVSNKTI